MATRTLLAVAKLCLAVTILAVPGNPEQADPGPQGLNPAPVPPTSARRMSVERLRALGFEELTEYSYKRENVRLDQISEALGFSVADLEVFSRVPNDPGDSTRCYFANASCEVYFSDGDQARAKLGSSIVSVFVSLHPEPKKWPPGSIHVTAELLETAGFTRGRDGEHVRKDVEVAELCSILQCSPNEFAPYYLMNDSGQSKRYSLSFPGGTCDVELRLKVVKCSSGGVRILELTDAAEVDRVRIHLDPP